MNRRGFLAGILAAGVAPAIVKVSSLMPVRAPAGWKVYGSGFLERDYAMALAESMRRTKEGVAARILVRHGKLVTDQLRPGLELVYGSAYAEYATFGTAILKTAWE